jgi:transcriptional regulator with XRE-family HTH domain
MVTMTDEIAEAVRIELARRNWSRAKLADEAGVSRQMISEMLNNKRARVPESWQKVFDLLELEVTVKRREPKND